MNVFNFFLDEAIKICGWKIKLSVFSMGSCLTDYSCIMGLCLKKKKRPFVLVHVPGRPLSKENMELTGILQIIGQLLE